MASIPRTCSSLWNSTSSADYMGVTVDRFGGIESLKAALDRGFGVQHIAEEGHCKQMHGIWRSLWDEG